MKELSKLLNFLGPNGVNIGSANAQVVGLASIMTNSKAPEIEVDEPQSEAAESHSVPTTTNTAKKTKKKGKKKN